MVGVVAHERGQVKGDGKSAAAMFEQIFVALVSLFGRREARELAHGEKLAAISGGVNAAREGRLAGIAEIIFFAPVFGQIGLRVEAANRHAGDCGEARVVVIVEIHAGGGADRPLGRFLQRAARGLSPPNLFRGRKDGDFRKRRRSDFRRLRLGAASFPCEPRCSTR